MEKVNVKEMQERIASGLSKEYELRHTPKRQVATSMFENRQWSKVQPLHNLNLPSRHSPLYRLFRAILSAGYLLNKARFHLKSIGSSSSNLRRLPTDNLCLSTASPVIVSTILFVDLVSAG